MISASDVPRVAAVIRVAGELFEVHGALALNVTAGWSTGPSAANLDPDSHQNRWQNCGADNKPGCPDCPHAIPSDPTGEAAIQQARAELATELQTRLERITEDAQWLKDTLHVLAPIVPPSTMNEKNDLWCDHHLRIGVCEVRHRKTLCRVCDDFLKLWKVRPPLALLKMKREGRPWTKNTVEAALEAEGHRIAVVQGVTAVIAKARPRQPNQNQKKKAG